MKMTNTNINNNADKAWSRLYERLEGDALVPDQTSVVKRVSFRNRLLEPVVCRIISGITN